MAETNAVGRVNAREVSEARTGEPGVCATGGFVSRWATGLLLGVGAMVGCDARPELASAALEGPLREALLTTPLACTQAGPVVERVMKTEDHGVVACHGFVAWDAIDGMRLDVDRYATIVEVEVRRSPVASHEVALSDPYLSKAKLMQLHGRVLSVLAGEAPTGETAFSVLTLANWNLGLNHGPPGTSQGGWPMLGLDSASDTRRGVVFLPTERIDHLAMIGCAEGHVVWIQGDAGEAYIRDLRRIRALDRDRLGSEPSLTELRAEGGQLLGAFVAEYAQTDASLTTLEGGSTVTPFDRGLARGLRRMLAVTGTGRYPAPAWREAPRDDIRVRLGAWAVQRGERVEHAIDHGATSRCMPKGEPSASLKLMSERF